MVLVGVLGQGAVGRAAADRLAAAGLAVRAADRDGRHEVLAAGPDVLLLALTRGEECAAQLAEATRLPPAVLDLTTQSPESALACARRAAALGARYSGGGLSAGGNQVRAGRAVLLLGPPVEPGSAAAAVVDALGRQIPFPGPDAAARAKVLHNWVLLVQQWAVSLALAGTPPDEVDRLVEVLAAGTAGRPVGRWSVVRDAGAPATSTYLARLAAKDLDEVVRTAPTVAARAGPLIATLRRAFAARPHQPYTEALLRAAGFDRGVTPRK